MASSYLWLLPVTAEVASSSLVVPAFFPNIVVPFLRNAHGRLWALARLYTTRGELCSYTRQPTTKAPSSLNRNPGYAPRFLSVQTPGANDSLVDQLLSLRWPQHQGS